MLHHLSSHGEKHTGGGESELSDFALFFGAEMFQAKCVLILFIHSSHQVNQTAIDEKPGNLIMLVTFCYVCIFKNYFNM